MNKIMNEAQPEFELNDLVRWGGMTRARGVLKTSYIEPVRKALKDGYSRQQAFNALTDLVIQDMRKNPEELREMIREVWGEVVEEVEAELNKSNAKLTCSAETSERNANGK